MLPELRPEATDLIARVKDFIEKECIPSEDIFYKQIGEGENRWNSYPEVINELKDKAKSKSSRCRRPRTTCSPSSRVAKRLPRRKATHCTR